MKAFLIIFLIVASIYQIETADGWAQVNGKWTYISNGVTLKGWQELNYNGGRGWFYFDSNGYMLTGWQELSWSGGVSWFYFDNSIGKMLTGWQKLNWSGGNDWFYFGSNGAMLKNICTTIDGKGYCFDPDGCWGGKSVVYEAKKYLGVPYKWAGADPSGFDCSGLVLYVYRRAAGMNLPHQAESMINLGTAVSRANLRLGDLVFPHSGHVGIYCGDDSYINAPKAGDVVKISKITQFLAGRRLL